MFDADAKFRAAHSDGRLDALLKIHGLMAPSAPAGPADPSAAHLEKIPLLMQAMYVVPFDGDDPDESVHPFEKFHEAHTLAKLLGEQSTPVSGFDLRFGMLKASLTDEEFLLSHGHMTLQSNSDASDPLEKAAHGHHQEAQEAIRGWVERALAKGITSEEILAQVHSGGASAENIALVEEAVQAIAAA